MTTTVTPELEALYRQLSQRHPELLERCTTWDDQLVDKYLLSFTHPQTCPGSCGGTGTVVPPFDTWLGRLVRVVSCVDFPYINCPTNDGDITQQCAAVITGTDFYGIGATPEEALLRALLAAEAAV